MQQRKIISFELFQLLIEEKFRFNCARTNTLITEIEKKLLLRDHSGKMVTVLP